MLRRLLLAATLLAGCAAGREAPTPAAPPERPDEPSGRLLFDGETLDGWQESAFGFTDMVSVADGALRIRMSDMLAGVTYTGDVPRTNYEVELDAMRTLGYDFFVGLTVPVGASYATLIVGGWGGTVVGISSLDGLDASDNETRRVMAFENDRWYHIRLRVTDESIRAWIDGEAVVDVGIEGKEVSIRPEVRPSIPFGLATWQTEARIKNIVLRELPGVE